MKTLLLTALAAAIVTPALAQHDCCADSVEMLSYANLDGSGGMHLAWRSASDDAWTPLGTASFVNSDFGPWGSHKKMYSPILTSTPDGGWLLTWIADTDGGVLATATSADLTYWSPQHYEMATADRQGVGQYLVADKAVTGNVNKVPMCLIHKLQAYADKRQERADLYAEQMKDDPTRFADLTPLAYSIKPQPAASKPISDMLIGIFFEDINYAADGGLYAELVQNRDFEYAPSDRGGDSKWNALTSWSFPAPSKGSHAIATDHPVHPNNPHYLRLTANEPGYEIVNAGYDGIPLQAGKQYNLSILARGKARLAVSLVDPAGFALQTRNIDVDSPEWHTYTASFTIGTNQPDAKLMIKLLDAASADIDMVSLFPADTFKGRPNGMRADLAQALADLKPRFVRFPGGCVAHGDGIDNIYDWKGSIGPLEARKPLRNIWGYHQTRGLGYHEYFELCEDLGAEPLPVLAAGVPCQNSGTKAHHSHDALTSRGQQDGIPMDEMDQYVQDVLDLIEYANGPVTSQWGALRAAAGHPEPFGLKYIGIGNEDMITEVFVPRFKMIYDAVRAAHPEVEVVGTVGPFYEGTDYEEGWKLAHELEIPYVDEHYYVDPAWLIYNQDYYDNYKRNATRVYLGEWAAHLPGRPSNLETSLAEALYLTSVERNADVVAMTSYAPLFSKDNHTQWRPDLIYFNNTEVRPSVDYYVQKLYGNNSGDSYIPAATSLSTADAKAQARVASSIVRDSATGDYIVKLANLLPVQVSTTIDVSKLKIKKGASWTTFTLAGQPTDTDLVPVEQTIKPAIKGGNAAIELQPYSFTVIRIPSR